MNAMRIGARGLVISVLFILFFSGGMYAFGESWEWSFSSAPYTIEEKDGSHIINMEGFSSVGSPGDPVLPRKVLNIALPPLTDPATLSLTVPSV